MPISLLANDESKLVVQQRDDDLTAVAANVDRPDAFLLGRRADQANRSGKWSFSLSKDSAFCAYNCP
jgi:hypothetical protein